MTRLLIDTVETPVSLLEEESITRADFVFKIYVVYNIYYIIYIVDSL